KPRGRGRLARNLSRHPQILGALPARGKAARSRRQLSRLASPPRFDGRTHHRRQARHRRHGRRRLSAAHAGTPRVPRNLDVEDAVVHSFKRLFSRALAAAPERLHFCAHSHHLWPDASYEGHLEAWDEAARLTDRKWDRIFGEVVPEAQSHIARELNLPDPKT